MNTLNPSAIVQYVSPVYFMIILVLVGFVYHLMRNYEYKDTLLASVVMGLILGLVFNSSYDLLKTFAGDLIFLLLVVLGGFLAVSLKKSIKGNSNWNSIKQSYEFPESQLNGDGWWYRQSPRTGAIIILVVCVLCIIMVIGSVSLLSRVEEPVQLTLQTPSSGEIKIDDIRNDKDGNVLLTFDNTTEFILKGSSESDATVKITVSELGIYNQTVPLDSENNFTYKFNIPTTGSVSKIIVEAHKPGKKTRILLLSLKK